MRHEFRFQQCDHVGRCFLDIPASAECRSIVVDGVQDIEFCSVSLNGATITGPLLEAVTDYMIEAGIVDAMRRLSGAVG